MYFGLGFIQVLVFNLFLFIFVCWLDRFPSLSAGSECLVGVLSLFTASFASFFVDGDS